MKKGFTLIEVLVVVLIMGILTSIALPQYRKSVVKTQIMRLFPLIRAIDSAEQVYYSTYNKYTGNFDDLDIAMPAGGNKVSSGKITYDNFSCYTYVGNADDPYTYSVSCDAKNAPRIEKYFARDYFWCWFRENANYEKFCKSIPGSYLWVSADRYGF